MKKLIALLTVFALVGSLVAADAALAAPKDKEPKEKSNNRDNENSNRNHDKERPDGAEANEGVLICHYTGRIVLIDGTAMVWGKVIRVDDSAVEAHLAHGDELALEGSEAGDDCWTLSDDENAGDGEGDGETQG